MQDRQMSLRKQVTGVENKQSMLEKNFKDLTEAIGQAFANLNDQLGQAVEQLNALVAVVGEEEVAAAVKAERTARLQKQSEAGKTALDNLVAGGLAVKADKVSDKSVIVGVEKDPLGTLAPPGRIQVQFSSLAPEFKEQFLGKVVGESVAVGENTLEITEVWDLVDKPVTEEPLEEACDVLSGDCSDCAADCEGLGCSEVTSKE